ncbi:16S rRNA processing protein RimM [Erythrobacter sp. JGD-13]|uniref:Ribosome maturation factor RimM n=1 Tax=Aurantiacibacter sediminis TaxID=2793064 RepID=A0ABS0N304_9SPHN|nr:ribosome maturation factor RimM [Aurantiacibacter sediminis]MBH5322350.1 16S rRNA processing protein RimM [Aurantiacibacter sediminis]
MSDSRTKPITLAAIAGAHGVAGEVRLKLFGDGIAALKQHKSLGLGKGEGTLTLKKVRDDNKGGAIARFAEITDRTAAEKLRGTTLTVSRDALPPLEEGEYYYVDLIGLKAVSQSGEEIGEVIAVQNYGAADVMEIARTTGPKAGKKFMVPMRAEAVPEWDDAKLVVSDDFAED